MDLTRVFLIYLLNIRRYTIESHISASCYLLGKFFFVPILAIETNYTSLPEFLSFILYSCLELKYISRRYFNNARNVESVGKFCV